MFADWRYRFKKFVWGSSDLHASADSPENEMTGGDLSPAEQAEARRYGRVSLELTLADMALDVIYLGIMAFLFARPLDAWLASFPMLSGGTSILRLLALFGVVVGIHILV